MSFIPKKIFFVKGTGFSRNSELRSFEEALRDAGIERFNIVKVSSIIPPFCKEVSREEGLKDLKTGQLVYSVISRISSKKKNVIVCASIGVAKPIDEALHGYLSEYHTIGVKTEKVGEFSEGLAAEMLATIRGIPFNSNTDFKGKQEILKINGTNIETKNITETAKVKKIGEWVTVIAAAIFII
jgi:arginine decarboxylase